MKFLPTLLQQTAYNDINFFTKRLNKLYRELELSEALSPDKESAYISNLKQVIKYTQDMIDCVALSMLSVEGGD